MTTYARMIGSVPVEVFPPLLIDGKEVPIAERFAPEFAAGLVEVPDGTEPQLLPIEPDPVLPHAELVARAQADIRTERQPIITALDGMQASALVNGDMDTARGIEDAKQGLRDLTDIDFSGCETYEDMRIAVRLQYGRLAAALPVSVRVAFSGAVS